jgi:signal transduction histidine kinase
MQQMPVSEWLSHAEGLLRAALPAQVALAVAIDDDAPVCIDLVQMEQVLPNLCGNAAHAMRHRGGEIRLIADRADPAATTAAAALRHMRLRVIDNGEGIAPDLLKKIFEPFFTTKPVGEGTGLGLAAVHGIVSSHEGAIEVASEPGVGTSFSVFLPLAPSGDST